MAKMTGIQSLEQRIEKAKMDVVRTKLKYDEAVAYFGNIRTLIPETSGQHFGIIRTA